MLNWVAGGVGTAMIGSSICCVSSGPEEQAGRWRSSHGSTVVRELGDVRIDVDLTAGLKTTA